MYDVSGRPRNEQGSFMKREMCPADETPFYSRGDSSDPPLKLCRRARFQGEQTSFFRDPRSLGVSRATLGGPTEPMRYVDIMEMPPLLDEDDRIAGFCERV